MQFVNTIILLCSVFIPVVLLERVPACLIVSESPPNFKTSLLNEDPAYICDLHTQRHAIMPHISNVCSNITSWNMLL